MHYVEDIDLQLLDDFQDGQQGTGEVEDPQRKLGHPAGGGETAGDDPPENIDVDVSPGDDGNDFLAGKLGFAAHNRGQGNRPGSFGYDFLHLQEEQNRVGDLVFIGGHHLIHIFLNQGKIQRFDSLDGDAVGERRGGGKADRAAFFEGLLHGGAVGRLDPDDPDSRQGLFQIKGDPGDQASSAERTDDHLHALGQIFLQELFADGPLPGDDRGVPEGVNEDEAFLLGNFQGQVGGIIHRAPVENDLRPVIAGGENFDQRRPLGHDDFGLDAEALAVIGDGLGMISRRGGDHPSGAIEEREAQEFIESAALFERAGHLQAFKLEKGLTTADLA